MTPMPCDMCGARSAPVAFSVIFGGKRAVRNYCISCAQIFKRGDAHAAQIALINMVEADENEKMLCCPKCGTTFDRIQKTGRMGCAECYRALSSPTGKMLHKLSGAQHQEFNESVVQAPQVSAEEERLQLLKGELAQAVNMENYERAAILRDEINALSHHLSGGNV